jgi:hypothetical protein
MSPPRFVGESAFVRWWPPGMLVFAFIVATSAGNGAVFFGAIFALCGVVFARFLPWRFAVVDEGLVLWFPFARRRFLAKDAITVRVGPGSPVALLNAARRFGYPLTDGLVERRRLMLRSVLLEHGFRVA